MRDDIAYEVRKLPEFVWQAIWLQTDRGFDWLWDAKDKENPDVQVYLDEEIEEIVDYIFSGYVLKKAEKWSNPRIRAYLKRDFTGR